MLATSNHKFYDWTIMHMKNSGYVQLNPIFFNLELGAVGTNSNQGRRVTITLTLCAYMYEIEIYRFSSNILSLLRQDFQSLHIRFV